MSRVVTIFLNFQLALRGDPKSTSKTQRAGRTDLVPAWLFLCAPVGVNMALRVRSAFIYCGFGISVLITVNVM